MRRSDKLPKCSGLLVLLLSALCCCRAEGRDLLRLSGESHPALTFVSGDPGTGQLREAAHYRVPGARAREVEVWLQTRFGMAELVFTCCGWEPKNGETGRLASADARFGGAVTVTMCSDETPVNERRRWREISWFHVLVQVWNL